MPPKRKVTVQDNAGAGNGRGGGKAGRGKGGAGRGRGAGRGKSPRQKKSPKSSSKKKRAAEDETPPPSKKAKAAKQQQQHALAKPASPTVSFDHKIIALDPLQQKRDGGATKNALAKTKKRAEGTFAAGVVAAAAAAAAGVGVGTPRVTKKPSPAGSKPKKADMEVKRKPNAKFATLPVAPQPAAKGGKLSDRLGPPGPDEGPNKPRMPVVFKKSVPAAKKSIADRIEKPVSGNRKPITSRLEKPAAASKPIDVPSVKHPNQIVAVAEEDFVWTDDEDDKADSNEELRKSTSPQKALAPDNGLAIDGVEDSLLVGGLSVHLDDDEFGEFGEAEDDAAPASAARDQDRDHDHQDDKGADSRSRERSTGDSKRRRVEENEVGPKSVTVLGSDSRKGRHSPERDAERDVNWRPLEQPKSRHEPEPQDRREPNVRDRREVDLRDRREPDPRARREPDPRGRREPERRDRRDPDARDRREPPRHDDRLVPRDTGDPRQFPPQDRTRAIRDDDRLAGGRNASPGIRGGGLEQRRDEPIRFRDDRDQRRLGDLPEARNDDRSRPPARHLNDQRPFSDRPHPVPPRAVDRAPEYRARDDGSQRDDRRALDDRRVNARQQDQSQWGRDSRSETIGAKRGTRSQAEDGLPRKDPRVAGRDREPQGRDHGYDFERNQDRDRDRNVRQRDAAEQSRGALQQESAKAGPKQAVEKGSLVTEQAAREAVEDVQDAVRSSSDAAETPILDAKSEPAAKEKKTTRWSTPLADEADEADEAAAPVTAVQPTSGASDDLGALDYSEDSPHAGDNSDGDGVLIDVRKTERTLVDEPKLEHKPEALAATPVSSTEASEPAPTPSAETAPSATEPSAAGSSAPEVALAEENAAVLSEPEVVLSPFEGELKELRGECDGGAELSNELRTKLDTAIQKQLKEDNVIDAFAALKSSGFADQIAPEILRDFAQRCRRPTDSSERPLWQTAQQVCSKLAARELVTAADRFVLLQTMSDAKQVNHIRGLLASMRAGANGQNELCDQESDFGTLVYPSLCGLATELSDIELWRDLCRNVLKDCQLPPSSITSSIIQALPSAPDMTSISGDLLGLFAGLISKGLEVSPEDAFRVLSVQVHAGKVRDAVDIVHDLLVYNLPALECTGSADCLKKLCRDACKLDAQYLDDTLDLFMHICEATPKEVTADLADAVLRACVSANSVSRAFLALRCATEVGMLVNSAQLEHVARLCDTKKDARIHEILAIAADAKIEPDSQLVAMVVSMLATTGEWKQALDSAESMIAGRIDPDATTLGSLAFALATAAEWDSLHVVLEALFAKKMQPTPPIVGKIAATLVDKDQWTVARDIATNAAQAEAMLPTEFFTALFAGLCSKAQALGEWQSLEPEVVLLYRTFKEHGGLLTSLKDKAVRHVGKRGSPAGQRLSGIADLENCPDFLSPFAYLFEFHKAGKLFEKASDVHAEMVEAGIIGGADFNAFVINTLMTGGFGLAIKAFESMCKLADNVGTPRHSLLGIPRTVAFITDVRSKGLPGHDKADELLALVDPQVLIQHATTGNVDSVVALLLDGTHDTEILESVRKVQLSTNSYNKVIQLFQDEGKMSAVVEVFAAVRLFSVELPTEVYHKAFDAAIEHDDIDSATSLYDRIGEELRELGGGEPPLTAFWSLIRGLHRQEDVQKKELSRQMFDARLGADLGDKIFAQGPWTVDMSSLTHDEMAWALAYHIDRLKSLRGMFQLNLSVGSPANDNVVLEKACIDLLGILEQKYPALLESKKPATDNTKVIIEAIDLETYFECPNTRAPQPPALPEAVVDTSMVRRMSGHALGQEHSPPGADLSDAGSHNPAEGIDTALLGSLLDSVDKVTGDEGTSADADTKDNADNANTKGLRRQNVRDTVAEHVKEHLKTYWKKKRMKTKDDYKHLARKFTRKFLGDGRDETLGRHEITDHIPEIQQMIDKFFKKNAGVYTSESLTRKQTN